MRKTNKLPVVKIKVFPGGHMPEKENWRAQQPMTVTQGLMVAGTISIIALV